MRIKRGSGLIVLGLALIVGAFGLMFWNMYDENRAQASTEGIMEQLQNEIPDYHPAEPYAPQATQNHDKPDLSDPAARLPEEQEIPDYQLDPQREMAVKIVNGRPYIGVLSVPVLGLELPVIQEWNYPDLRIAPCRYVGSVYTDNLVIAAHNYESHFGKLKQLKTGDLLTFTDMDGEKILYEVQVIDVLQPTAVDTVKNSDFDLVLYTCTYGGESRVVVFCNRVKL